jgi:hypothetical protein
MSTAVADRPDTTEMRLIHDMFRRGFGSVPDLVRGVPAGDTARAARVVRFQTELTTGLHHHHTTEDEMMWPLLLDRVPTDHALVLRMEEQHERIAELIERAETRAAEFERTAAASDGEALATTVTALGVALDEHLAEEEGRILPLVEESLTVAEWEAMGERAREGVPRDRQFVLLGYVMDGMPHDQRAELLAAMPLIGRLMWRFVGRRAFVKEYRDIFGADPS